MCARRGGELLKQTRLLACLAGESDGTVVFDITGCVSTGRRLAAQHQLTVTPRYMDQFYLCFGAEDVGGVGSMMDELFGFIAGTYEERVDVARNRDNLGNLLELMRERTSWEGTVVDFGCGTGLGKVVGDGMGVKLVGYEPNPEMRRKAVERGMVVWGRRELERVHGERFRAVVASYVLHLPGVVGDLRLTWERLRRGGVVAANFHKGQREEETTEILGSWGADVERIASGGGWAHHGDYVVFVRS